MIASQTSHMRNRHWKIVFASLALCLLAAVAYAQVEADFLAGTSKSCANCALERAALKRRDLSGADLAGAKLAGAVLHRARLMRAKLIAADLTDANLNKTDLKNASLAAAKGPAYMNVIVKADRPVIKMVSDQGRESVLAP